MADLELGDLYNQQVDDAAVNEATRSETLTGGSYTFGPALRVEAKVDDRETFDNGDLNPNYKRQYAHVYGPAANVEGKGKIAFDISWDVRRKAKDGKLDRMSKLWGQVCKALDMKGVTVGDVLEALKSYPINVFITESFKTPAKEWVNPKTEEERAECFRNGYTAYNFVQSVGKVKWDVPF